MRANIVALPAGAPFDTLAASLHVDPTKGPQRLYPVVDEAMQLREEPRRGAAPRTRAGGALSVRAQPRAALIPGSTRRLRGATTCAR